LKKWPGDETWNIDVPQFNEDSQNTSPISFETKELDIEGVLTELSKIEESFPDIPPFEALRLYFSQPLEICPTSLLDPYEMFLIEAEYAAREYHRLPFEGGLWDQPLVMLRIFDTVRSERNHYERIRMETVAKKNAKTHRQAQTSSMLSGKQLREVATSPNTTLPPRQGNVSG
jgi:hypothetical protein